MSRTLHVSYSELLVDGPGLFEARQSFGVQGKIAEKTLLLEIRINPSRFDRTAILGTVSLKTATK
jgi:hypothetical protein